MVVPAHVNAVRHRARHLPQMTHEETRPEHVARVRDAVLRDVHGEPAAPARPLAQDDPEPLRVDLPAEIVRLRPGRDAAADEELAHAPRIEADQSRL